MEISPEKKQEAHKRFIGSCKFGAIFCPLLLILSAPPWFKAHSQVPVYQRDCRSAQIVANPLPSSVPCYDEMATAHLKSYYHRGNPASQDVLLDFPDGRTATMVIDSDNTTWWTSSQVDGSCLLEVWHGEVMAVLKPGARLLCKQNPELAGGTTAFIGVVLFPGVLTLVIWVCLLVMWQRGDLLKEKK